MIALARAVLVLAALAALAGSAGGLLVDRRTALESTGLWRVARFVAGLGLLQLTLFGFAAAGWLREGPLLSAAFAFALGPWLLRRIQKARDRDLPAVDKSGWRRPPAGAAGFGRLGLERLGFGLLGLFLTSLVPLAVSPPVSWDAAVYHLTLPRLFLEHGGFRPVPMSVYAEWPLGTELFYAVGLAFGGVPAAKLLHWGFGLLLVGTLVAVGRRQGLSFGAVSFAAALVVTSPIVLFELQVAYVDIALAAFVLATFAFIDQALDARPGAATRTALLFAGIAAGLAASTKVTGAVLALAPLVLFLPRCLRAPSREGTARWLRLGALFALPFSMLALLWPLKAWVHTGNPIYPFAWEIFGGADWSPALAERFAAWQRSIGMGRELRDYLLLPIRVPLLGTQGDYARFDGAIGVRWLLVAPLALAALRRAPGRRALTVAALHLVFWSLTSQQARFLIPTLPLLALATAHGGTALVNRLLGRLLARRDAFQMRLSDGVWTGAGALLLAAALFGGDAPLAPRSAQFLQIYAAHPEPEAPRPPVWAAVDGLPGDARLLLLGTNQAWHASRETLADSFFEASQINDWLAPAANADAVAKRLHDRGVTHLLIALREVQIPYPPALLALLASSERVETVYADSRHRLLALRPETVGESTR